MKAIALVPMFIGTIKTRVDLPLLQTTDAVHLTPGAQWNVIRVDAIYHDMKNWILKNITIEWMDDKGWTHRASIANSHFPKCDWKFVPETDLEKQLCD